MFAVMAEHPAASPRLGEPTRYATPTKALANI
jgi:hypothetical protein